MTTYEIIKKKRDGASLTDSEITYFIEEYLNGGICDYQMSALLMAIYFNGMDDREISSLTKVMADSGEKISLGELYDITVDKHSTGGVGDKTTLVVAPVVASLGCVVAKMSGRGLGFTGGTVDKLSAIPGYRVDMCGKEFLSTVKRIGISVVSQSDNLTPADKKIYALRDTTATVESIPLIASSIMSKKLATGSKSIVLDVKYGSGAFMKDILKAELLAQKMVNIGKSANRNMAAVLTNMDKPLGFAIGNNLEVIEAIEVLKGEMISDLYEECVALSATMVSLAKKIPVSEAEAIVMDSIRNGAALDKFKEWISTQGGDISYIDNTDKFEKAKYIVEVYSNDTGYVNSMNTEQIGFCASLSGAGRSRYEDSIDFAAGLILDKKTGDFVNKGDRLCCLHTNNKSIIEEVKDRYVRAIELSNKKPETSKTIYKTIW
ncbi:MAG: thymidine phosphorylase [Clostridia bacterium]|nr:thymidine phosphorylase [Clostridia bacterium]